MTISKTEFTVDGLRREAYTQIDSLFRDIFPEHNSKITGIDATFKQIYDSKNLRIIQVIWDIAVEPASLNSEREKLFKNHERQIHVKILKKDGYTVGEVKYQEGYQLDRMVEAIIYPDGWHEIYTDNNKYLSLDEQWDLAWKHYCNDYMSIFKE